MGKIDARVTGQSGALLQCAVIPIRHDAHGDVEILLITSRGSGRWLVPKGWPMRTLTAAQTAAREAFEEAGVIGTIVDTQPLGRYRIAKGPKGKRARAQAAIEVEVFMLAVHRQLDDWPERGERRTRWSAPAEAARLVGEPALAALIMEAARLGVGCPGVGCLTETVPQASS